MSLATVRYITHPIVKKRRARQSPPSRDTGLISSHLDSHKISTLIVARVAVSPSLSPSPPRTVAHARVKLKFGNGKMTICTPPSSDSNLAGAWHFSQRLRRGLAANKRPDRQLAKPVSPAKTIADNERESSLALTPNSQPLGANAWDDWD